MERKNNWLSAGFGKKLNRLHAWNAWVTLVLALTGIVLSIGWIRGDLGAVRVMLKQGHIWIGVFSILLLALYVPLLPKHLGQLRKRRKAGQQGNLAGVLVFTAGWIVSGVILWQFRSLPPVWSNTALFIHDAFTWVGVPYLLYHSVTRSRWVKKRSAERDTSASGPLAPAAGAVRPQADAPQPILRADTGAVFRDETRDAGGAATQASAWSESLGRRMTRGAFLKLGAAAALAVVIGPSFVRWARGNLFGGGGLEEAVRADANRMLPAPVPLAESSPPVGGGAKGDFRIYTVTENPRVFLRQLGIQCVGDGRQAAPVHLGGAAAGGAPRPGQRLSLRDRLVGEQRDLGGYQAVRAAPPGRDTARSRIREVHLRGRGLYRLSQPGAGPYG